MSFTQSASTGIVGIETNEFGNLMYGRIPAIPTGGLDTTTGLYGAGCVIIDASTSNMWVNIGTATAPVWSMYNGFAAVSVPAASVPLLYGGTNVQALPPLPSTMAYVVNDMVLEYIGAGGTNFTGGGSTTRAVYGSGGTNVAIQVSQGTATIVGGTVSKVWQAAPFASATGAAVIGGSALFIDNTGAAYAGGGTSSMKVSLWYSIITV